VTDLEEAIIIKNVLAGDAQAFSILVNTYKDMAVQLSYNILLNREDAEEAAQDAFVKCYQFLSTYKAEARFATWFYRIVVNTALNKRKLKKYYPEAINEAEGEEWGLLTDHHHEAVIKTEQKKFIQLALSSMNVRERLCLTLYYLNELSVKEIREITGIPPSNIKVLLFRGRKNFYQELQKHIKTEITSLL